eukprot:CAMPEP_0198699000 /NCGR_PEP_ID=MMETSP1468-20131203/346850_1 /TAXON_ID=1461545 /ORGANISM="Mantoniella sp, Strain CCMP1436" /LENGTH=239 /DNA_ID=CAMNT_0044456307 /DNA_START=169 /DNA_END=888 /DNA_ORIENTATION=-
MEIDFDKASALEMFGHVASVLDIVLDIYLTVEYLGSDDELFRSCGIASACVLSLSLTINSQYALVAGVMYTGEAWQKGVAYGLAPIAFPVAFFTVLLEMINGFATHYASPMVVLMIWPLIIICVVDALTDPTGYATYVKRGLISARCRCGRGGLRSDEAGYKGILRASIFLCCVEDIPEIVIQGISTLSPVMTSGQRLAVYFSLFFSIYRVGFEGIRKLFAFQGRIQAGKIKDFDDVTV